MSSVSNIDGTLTVSPTTGAVVASLNTGHANAWTALQTFADATLKQNNAAGTYGTTFASAATAARVWTFPDETSTAVGTDTTQVLTNKTMSGASNTFSAIPDSAISYANEAANRVFAGPATGVPAAPTFRTLVAADIPSLSGLYLPLAGGTMDANAVISAAAGTGGLSFGSATGATTLSTGNLSYTGASTKTVSIVTSGSGGSITLTAGAASTWSTSAGALTLTSAAAATWSTAAGALTLTSAAAATWSTAAGALSLDSAAALNLGITNATAIAVGKSGITTTVTGGLTQLTGAVSLTGNAASSFTTSSGALTLTSAAAATWSTAAGALTLTSAAAATWSTAAGALTLTSAAAATWSTAAGILTLNGVGGMNLQGNGTNGIQLSAAGLVTLAQNVTMAANVNETASAGTSAFDWSAGTGIFKTTTGANTLSGPTNVAPPASTGTPSPAFKVTPAAHTALTASTEYNSVSVAAVSQQFATGALTLQRFVLINAPTYAFVGASTISDAATIATSGAPITGTSATITRSHDLYLGGGKIGSGVALTYMTGATMAGSGVGHIVDTVNAWTSGDTAVSWRSAGSEKLAVRMSTYPFIYAPGTQVGIFTGGASFTDGIFIGANDMGFSTAGSRRLTISSTAVGPGGGDTTGSLGAANQRWGTVGGIAYTSGNVAMTFTTTVATGSARAGFILNDTNVSGTDLIASLRANNVEKAYYTSAGLLGWIAGNTQTTVGAAGGASALPATPTHYLKVDRAGTTFVIPAYAAS